MAEIKQIKIGAETHDIVPEKLQSGSYHLTPPSLSKDSTIATTDDLPSISHTDWYCTFGPQDEVCIGAYPSAKSERPDADDYYCKIGVFSVPKSDQLITNVTLDNYSVGGIFLGGHTYHSDYSQNVYCGLYVPKTTTFTSRYYDNLSGDAYLVSSGNMTWNRSVDYLVENYSAYKNYIISISEVIGFRTSKQATLISGTNIKTINDQSILGSGNISISSGPSITYSNNMLVIA